MRPKTHTIYAQTPLIHGTLSVGAGTSRYEMKTREIPPLTEKNLRNFWRRVDKSPGHGPRGDCWEWTAGKAHGYGAVSIGGRMIIAPRVSYFIHHGRDPISMCVLHTCDHPACVNPNHLWLGTRGDNCKDAASKGRMATGKNHGLVKHPERVQRGDGHWSRRLPGKVSKGEANGEAKLTEVQVREIRQLHAAGGITQRTLATMYDVHFVTIHQVVRFKTWRHTK